MKQLLTTQSAKEAFMQVDTSQKIRKALLWKSVPRRGPYRTGDLVRFSKKGKWFGPARVLSNEARSSLWLSHNTCSRSCLSSSIDRGDPEEACFGAPTKQKEEKAAFSRGGRRR